jgi:basic membrane protein A
MLKRVDVAVFSTIEDAKAGKFEGGAKKFGLANKGIDFADDSFNAKLLTDDVRKRANELKAEIMDGKIVVPDYYKKH